MQTLNPIIDPTYDKSTTYTKFEEYLIGFINDKRDLPFLYLTFKISTTMIPVGILLFMPFITGYAWWMLAALYFFMNNFVYKGPFGLMLHCSSHRTLYKKKVNFMNYYLPWFVGPFFGQTPETYYSHHIWMHHPENNLPEDESTTMFYKRDSLKDFFKYFLDFLLVGMVKLVGYFAKKNRKHLIYKCITGEFLFIAMCVGLSFVNFPATFMVFILPFFISRLIMMLGNWTQHAFIDQDDPGNPYKNSITCVNVKYNSKCWNDGYHITHHIKPFMHWTEHPVEFMATQNEYVANKAIVFQGIDFLKIFFFLMNKNYNRLADYFVNINNAYMSKEEVVELLKSRTIKFERLA